MARLVREHGANLRYTRERGWMTWDGARWRADDDGGAMRFAKKTAASIFDEIRAAGTQQQKELFSWARKSQSVERLRAMLALAQSEIPARLPDFDADPWALNCLTGTVNLKTGELRPHRADALCSRITPIEYRPDADCPIWTAFLLRAMGGNQSLIEYLQRAVGYTLTGLTVEQIMIFVYGLGANGKSVFLEALQRLTGEYGVNTRTETIMQRRESGIPNDIARLAGARYVAVNEVSDGQRLNESLVKDLTGGDTVTARFLHREFFDFRPAFKLWIRGNHKPQIRGTDHGIWRRIHMVPFTVTIPDDEKDAHLGEKLAEEMPGILAWAVRGCLAWQREGLNPPAEVLAAVKEYREEMDILGAFLDERCMAHERMRVTAKAIYAEYRQWCDDNGQQPYSQRRLGQALTERGFDKERARDGYQYIGLGLAVNLVNDCEPSSDIHPYRAREGGKQRNKVHEGSQGSRGWSTRPTGACSKCAGEGCGWCLEVGR